LTGEVTDNPTGAVVAVTRVGDYRDEDVLEAVRRQFELLGGLDRFIARGDRVLLKPNFIVPRRRELAAQTDPAVILAVARLVKDFGARPFVGDSPAWGNFESCLQALELAEPLRRLGVPFGPLDRPRRLRIDGSLVSISRVALDADRIINLPKFKAHQQLGATFAVKNMFGAVCGKQKAFWHFARGKSHEQTPCAGGVDHRRHRGDGRAGTGQRNRPAAGIPCRRRRPRRLRSGLLRFDRPGDRLPADHKNRPEKGFWLCRSQADTG